MTRAPGPGATSLQRTVGWCLAIALLVASAALAEAPDIPASRFSDGDLAGWQTRHFAGVSHYRLVADGDDTVLHAQSRAGASAFGRKIRIDLSKTPMVSWRWKIAARLSELDERSKAGDDYAARLYLIVDGGLMKWRTRTVTYVWSSSNPSGASWRNAHNPRNAAIIAVRGRDDQAGVWHSESRNVYEDFLAAFGEQVRYVDAVAVMSDGDNSGQPAEAWYGDIVFSAQ